MHDIARYVTVSILLIRYLTAVYTITVTNDVKETDGSEVGLSEKIPPNKDVLGTLNDKPFSPNDSPIITSPFSVYEKATPLLYSNAEPTTVMRSIMLVLLV